MLEFHDATRALYSILLKLKKLFTSSLPYYLIQILECENWKAA